MKSLTIEENHVISSCILYGLRSCDYLNRWLIFINLARNPSQWRRYTYTSPFSGF